VDQSTRESPKGVPYALPCVFQNALAAGCASCSTSVRQMFGEREEIGCGVPGAHADCAALAALTRERSAFALRLAPGASLSHAITMRLQCGGLGGLRRCVRPDEPDVRRLVAAARAAPGGLVDLPWPEIVISVMAWQGRRSGRWRPA